MTKLRQWATTLWSKLRGICSKINQITLLHYSVVQILVLSVFMNIVIEAFSRFSLWKALVYTFTRPAVFLTNTLIIAVVLTPAILFRRRSFFYFLGCMLWFAVGVINFILLHNRVTPFNANDFKMVGDGIKVALHYYNIFQLILLALAILLAISLLVYAFLHFPKTAEPIRYIVRVPYCLAIMVGCLLLISISSSSGIMAKSLPNLAKGYHEYGLPYCFISSIVDVGIDKPSEYSPEHIENVLDPLLSATPSVTVPVQPDDEDAPNVIFIQLESFFDPQRISGIEFTEDPIPTFRRLMKEYSSGLLTVPSISAGTANTEFEILTGMNMADFGTGEYPFKTILKRTTTESIAYNLSKLGYRTHAIHNNTATFYSRHIVYSNLGFEVFTPIELMTNVEMNELNWAKDAVLYDEILTSLDSTEGADLVFTVSVQGHGSYPDEDILSESIELVDIFDAYDDSTIYGLKYYISQLNEMDSFINHLVKHLSVRDERTVLVLYGDHLPGFDFGEEDLKKGGLLQTEYVIWSNFDMEVEKQDLYSYQLSAKVMELLGYNEGLITKLHQNYNGNDTANYLSELNLLSYDMLYGEQYCWNGVNPYAPTDIVYGNRDLVLTELHTIYDAEKESFYIQAFGENFTPYCEITINGERMKDTIYVSENELFLADVSLAEAYKIAVAAPANDSLTLRTSEEYIFHVPVDIRATE